MDEGVLGVVEVAEAGVFHAHEGGLPAVVGVLGDRGIELHHAVIEIIVKDGKQGAALRIGAGAMRGVPLGPDRGLVEGASLGFAQADADTDVLLDLEGADIVGSGAGTGPAGVGVVTGRGGLRDEREGFLQGGPGTLAGKGDAGGGGVGIAGRRGRGGGGCGDGTGGGGLREDQEGGKDGGGEEEEKAFHRCEGNTILRRSILKSESRWMASGIPKAMSPWEVARRLAHLPGLVFLDSALARPGAVSRIAAWPEEIIEGETAADWERLRDAIRSRAGRPGMAAGYVEYEGRFRFGLYGRVLTFFHDEGRWMDEGGLEEMMGEPAGMEDEGICFQPEMAGKDYEAMVRRAQEYIGSGDIYQVNLAHRLSGIWSGRVEQALGFYARLRECSPAPYAGLMFSNGRVIASSSPELFLRIEGREVVTRPIKGTRPRAGDAAADAVAARELGESAKERAELVMITDLERNDLGQVCDYGSVVVRELLKLERYAQVHHLVSTVTGRLREEVDAIGALRACFPGGSVTGAPKKRAREIIAELEAGERGVYTGAIGYVGYEGRSAFNIAIRTAVLERDGRAHFHAGAGIVADSQPRKEWEETMWKAAGLLRAADGRASAAKRD